MLGPLRRFSTSIYAKILLGIIVIPFVFWGMGGVFSGGNKNIIIEIDNDKYRTEEFINFMRKYINTNKKITPKEIQDSLSLFAGEKLINKEVQHYKIMLSNNSLAQILKSKEKFQRNGEFSRIEYEKFLIQNNITATTFENNLLKIETKKQLLNLIGGGVYVPNFLVNNAYNKINQKRIIQIINLNQIINNKISITDDNMNSYFENNKENYIEIYKTIKLLEINPKNLTGKDEFDDLFFERLDKIDDLIAQGNKIDFITEKFNLGKSNILTINAQGEGKNSEFYKNLPNKLIQHILNLTDSENVSLTEIDEKYFVTELVKTESVQKKYEDKSVKKDIKNRLKDTIRRKFISNLISKINKKEFTKISFDNLSKEENAEVKKIKLDSQNDSKILKEGLVNEIYSFAEKSIIIVNDIGLTENYLIYIDEVKNVTMNPNSKDYEKYMNLANLKITTDLYNTYDRYLKKKYKISINNQALDAVKNNFN